MAPPRVAALVLALLVSTFAAVGASAPGPPAAEASEELSLLLLSRRASREVDPARVLLPLGVDLLDAPGRTAAKDRFAHIGNSSILVATLLVQDGQTYRPDQQGQYQAWIGRLLQNTVRDVRRHGHSLAVRTELTLPAPKGQMESCKGCPTCLAGKFRENVNWEKFQLLLDYFEGGGGNVTHILFMDVDATFIHPDLAHDTARAMAAEMDRRGASLLLADEDYRGPAGTGRGKANGGVQMWRNTAYSKALLKVLLAAHRDMFAEGDRFKCTGNEQYCLQMLLRGDQGALAALPEADGGPEPVVVLSGLHWNRHPCLLKPLSCRADFSPNGADESSLPAHLYEPGLEDTGAEIMHFMGGWKGEVEMAMSHRMAKS